MLASVIHCGWYRYAFTDSLASMRWASPRSLARSAGRGLALIWSNSVLNAYLYQPQWITLANKNLKGLWKDMPVFVNDLSALSWG